MNGFHVELQEKKAEAEQMLEIISDISARDGSVVKTAMLKSAFVLLLYNMIESTAFLTLDKVHEKLSEESYLSLNTKLRKMWAEFYFSSHGPASHYDNLEKTFRGALRLPLLEDFMARVKLFSGNLDARKIDSLLSRYGMNAIRSADREKLQIIKNRRNALAHGEKMFKQACRDLSENDLHSLKFAVFNALDDMIAQVDSYLAEKKYLDAHVA